MVGPTRRLLRNPFALVLVFAALVRAGHLWFAHKLPYFTHPESDALFYDQAARRIAAGDWLLGHAVMRMSPGYHYFLGAVYALFGSSPWPIRLVQSALGLCSTALVFDSARALSGARLALVAAFLMAGYGPLIFYESVLLDPALSVFLHALLLWLCVAARSSLSLRRALAIGSVFGLCSVVRPNALLLSLPVALFLLSPLAQARGEPRRLLRLAAFVLGATCVLAPMFARNLIASGEPVLLTAHGGYNLYLGNGPGASGTHRVLPGIAGRGPAEQFDAFHAAAERALARKLSAREADAYWMHETLRAIAREPLPWLRVMLRKLHLYWNGRELSNVYDSEFYRELNPALRFTVQFTWIAPLALLGTLLWLFAEWRRRVVALCNLASCAAVALVLVVDRYRLPIVPGALLAGTGALAALHAAYVRRDARALAGLGMGLLAFTAVAIPVPAHKHFDDELWKLGTGFHEQGQLLQAERAYLRALELDPEHVPALNNLAALYAQAHKPELARARYLQLEAIGTRRSDPEIVGRARAGLARLMSAQP